MAGNCPRSLSHLHKGYDPLLHTGTAGSGKQHHRQLMRGRILERSCYLLADNAAHACHHEVAVHNAYHSLIPVYPANSRDNGFIHPALFPELRYLLLISRKIYRVQRGHSRVQLGESVLICRHFYTLTVANTRMVVARGTHGLVALEIITVCDRSASRTLEKQPLRYFYPLSLFLLFLWSRLRISL